MKFTKEEAVKELAAKYKPRYGEPAKWERTINECVEHTFAFIGEDSEIELDEFVGKASKLLDTIGGFVLKETSDVASGYKQQIEELKKQAKAEPGKEKNPEGDSALLERIEKLERALAEKDKAAMAADKRKQIMDLLKAKGAKEDKVAPMLEKAQITEDTDVEKEAGDYLEIYNKMFADGDDDTTPLKPKGESTENRFKSVVQSAGEAESSRR